MSLITPAESKNISADAKIGEKKRAIAYSMDLLIPGLYIWLGIFTLRIGGEVPDDQPYRYPGTLNSRYGIALVLPGYHVFTTYKTSYDPR
jgi:hypothetical protein